MIQTNEDRLISPARHLAGAPFLAVVARNGDPHPAGPPNLRDRHLIAHRTSLHTVSFHAFFNSAAVGTVRGRANCA